MLEMWQNHQTVSYDCGGDSHFVSVIPGLALTNYFWRKGDGLETLMRQLAIHEIRLRPSLTIQSWSGHLRLECPQETNMVHYTSVQLPSQYVELAVMGRLLDWKLCTVVFYPDQYCLCFYNTFRNEWLGGILYDGDVEVESGRKIPPRTLELFDAEGHEILVHRDDREGETEKGSRVNISYRRECEDDKVWREVRLDSKIGKEVSEHIHTNVYERLFG